jgi:hypothetical protein
MLLVVVALASAAMGGCARTVEYRMRQPIDMGPFSFSVISASQGKRWQSAEGTFREIEVRIRVERDSSAPFTVDFTSFFLGKLEIVDAAGNTIGADPRPLTPTYAGGRYRSALYSCVFRYSRSSDGVTDFEAIGTEPRDFRLIVTHPEPAGTEPRRAAVQLE